MRTIFKGILYHSNQGWKFKPLEPIQGYKNPKGSYFVYQKNIGPPIGGGTQPVWSYDLTKIVALWKEEGGYVFDENGKILRKDG